MLASVHSADTALQSAPPGHKNLFNRTLMGNDQDLTAEIKSDNAN